VSTGRLAIALVLVMSTAVIAWHGGADIAAGSAPALMNLPYDIGGWSGQEAPPIDAETRRLIAADEILNRDYFGAQGQQASLYVAYYNQQRPGVSIHSPLLCLPGTGWNVLSNDIVTLADREGAVRRLIAQKDASRVVILYWYAIHGRMIASDLASRVQLFTDRIRLGRNDAALVRVVIPSTGSDAIAERTGLSFMSTLAPYF
jgi:EpsI family protein